MTDPSEDMLCLQDFDETLSEFYRMVAPKVPWGDYGGILVHGMTRNSATDSHPPELLRAGPFVPPISFPGVGRVIVTDVVRRDLESSDLTGFTFIPAIKRTIVPIDWHEWDLLAEEPKFYPGEGEPENYISEEEHSSSLANRMPDLWQMVISPGATEIREPPRGAVTPTNMGQVFIRAGSWQGADFFRADTTLFNYVTPRARLWMIDRYPAWIAFRPVLVK